MDTYLKKFREDLLKGVSETKVAISEEEQTNLDLKVANYAMIKSYELQNIGKYTFFLILNIRVCRENYLSEITIYDEIFRLFVELIDEFPPSPNTNSLVLVPSKLYKFAKDLPEYTSEEVITAFQGHQKIIRDTLELGPDDIITSEILNKFFGEGKIDEDFWNKAFEYFKNKEVIKKYKKDKIKHLPDSIEELMTYEERLPKELISYARTSTFRLRQEIEKKSVDMMKFDERFYTSEIHNNTPSIQDLIDQEKLEMKLKNIIETLNEREESVINLKYYKNLSQKEISDRLGISQQMVSKHFHKAMKKLKKAIL